MLRKFKRKRKRSQGNLREGRKAPLRTLKPSLILDPEFGIKPRINSTPSPQEPPYLSLPRENAVCGWSTAAPYLSYLSGPKGGEGGV